MTAGTQHNAELGTALVILDPDRTALLQELDRTFTRWGHDAGASEISPPPVYAVSDLEKFDVYTNFPQLQLVAAALDLDGDGGKPDDGRFTGSDLDGAKLGLPHATCYGAYLFYENARLGRDTLVTLVNRCFRNEDHYGGLSRLLSFQMREVVALGSYEHTQRVLAQFTDRIQDFAEALSLPLNKVPASDPFFEDDGARAVLQKLSPVKYEFQSDGLAISSVNAHRNFFGERCNITLAGQDEIAYTSCVAFGLERWLSVLLDQYDADPVQALDAVRDAVRKAG